MVQEQKRNEEIFSKEKALQVLTLLIAKDITSNFSYCYDKDLRNLLYMIHAMEKFSYKNYGHTVLHDQYMIDDCYIIPVNLFRMFLAKSENLRNVLAALNLEPYDFGKTRKIKNSFEIFAIDDLYDECYVPLMSICIQLIPKFRPLYCLDFLSEEDQKAIKFARSIEPLFLGDPMIDYPEFKIHKTGEIINPKDFLLDPPLDDNKFKYECIWELELFPYGKNEQWDYYLFSPKFPLHPDNIKKYQAEVEEMRNEKYNY